MAGRMTALVGLMTAETLSLLGNQIAAVAIPLLVLQFTGSPLTTAIAGIANALPVVFAALIGGKFIDKYGAWRSSIGADLLSFLSVMGLVYCFSHWSQVPVFLVFLLVLFGALFDPTGIAARQSLVPRLTHESGKPLETINSWRGGLENGADFLGPVLGAACIGLWGVVPTFYLNAFTFLACAGIFAFTVPRTIETTNEKSEMAGLSTLVAIWNIPSLKTLAVSGTLGSTVLLPFLGLLLPTVASQQLHHPAWFGIWMSVFGLAATLGAMSFVFLSKRFSYSKIYYGGWLLTAGAILAIGFASNGFVVAGCCALAGILLGAGNPLQQTVIHEAMSPSKSGQVFATLGALHFGAGPVGFLVAGIAAEYLPLQWIMVGAGAVLILMVLFNWKRLPLEKNG